MMLSVPVGYFISEVDADGEFNEIHDTNIMTNEYDHEIEH